MEINYRNNYIPDEVMQQLPDRTCTYCNIHMILSRQFYRLYVDPKDDSGWANVQIPLAIYTCENCGFVANFDMRVLAPQ